MLPIITTVIKVLGVIAAIAAVLFILQGISHRARWQRHNYEVGRQADRQQMLVAFVRGTVFAILAVVIFAIAGLSDLEMVPADDSPTRASISEPSATATPIAESETAATPGAPVEPDSESVDATPTPEPTAEPTTTPQPESAVVSSENGLWLREAPGGTETLELLADGAPLQLLEGVEEADDLSWQQVITEAGNEGWVAVDFITYQ